MMRVLLIGAGGHGRVVLDIIRNMVSYVPAGFVDADAKLTGQIIDGCDVLGTPDDIEALCIQHEINGAIVSIGDNKTRWRYAKRLEKQGVTLISAIHPHATVADTADVDDNVVIAAGAMVCAHAEIGKSVILNTGCIVDHESVVEAGSHICPGVRLAGRVKVRAGAFVGIGATVIQGVTIGRNATVGAGAVVLHDVPDNTLAVGCPARLINRGAA
jgi:sugar O-acyltransferase (sialic acid O-acetyltransferase NeuD family)